MPAVGIAPTGAPDKAYPGNLTPYVTITCIVAAMGGLIFGYDIGISGNNTQIIHFFDMYFKSTNLYKLWF